MIVLCLYARIDVGSSKSTDKGVNIIENKKKFDISS